MSQKALYLQHISTQCFYSFAFHGMEMVGGNDRKRHRRENEMEVKWDSNGTEWKWAGTVNTLGTRTLLSMQVTIVGKPLPESMTNYGN